MAAHLLFDVELPNAREGISVPIGFGSTANITKIALEAERLGYNALWTNDFITPTPCYGVPDAEPPNWYEPIVTLAYCAAITKNIGLGTAVLMAPFRDVVVLAKEIATLDQLSSGRILLGLGIGMCRDEFEAIRPRERKMVRGKHLDEFIESLRSLLATGTQPVSFAGKYIEFSGVKLDPKSARQPLPIFVPGRAQEALERAARFDLGVMVRAGAIAGQTEKLKPLVEAQGRDIASVDMVAELELRLGPTREKAIEQYGASRQGKLRTEIRGMQLDQIVAGNWIGTGDEVCEKVDALVRQGVRHFSVLNIAADTITDRLEQMQMFAEQVMPRFKA